MQFKLFFYLCFYAVFIKANIKFPDTVMSAPTLLARSGFFHKRVPNVVPELTDFTQDNIKVTDLLVA